MSTLRTYLERFSSLPGWFMEESAVIWDCFLDFQKRQHVKGHALEIGVYHGRSAAMICLHLAQQEKLVLIDPHRLETVKATLSTIKPDNLICYSCMSRRIPIAELSALYGQCRWIHVDGDHSASACSHDLALADYLLGDHGVVVVDDFMTPRHPQVMASVFNYLYSHPFSFRMFLCGFGKAYLARPPYVFQYLRFIRDHIADELSLKKYANRISFFKTTVPDDYNCFGMGRYEDAPFIGLNQDKSCILI
jgi:methyltransferase family protein